HRSSRVQSFSRSRRRRRSHAASSRCWRSRRPHASCRRTGSRPPRRPGRDARPLHAFLLDSGPMDWAAIALSLRLAAIVSLALLVVGLPLAYWLTFSSYRWKFLVESVVALPLVLPPTVLGFYVLVAIGARSPLGRLWTAWTGHGLAFTFEALVIASIL